MGERVRKAIEKFRRDLAADGFDPPVVSKDPDGSPRITVTQKRESKEEAD